ncbi:MAG: polymer-forming cytoskeletal protein, partial [Pseudomonadota bacterium]
IGSLNASEVKIENNAHVLGDIFHDTLSIEAGAIIEGSLKQRFEKEVIEHAKDKPKPVNDVKAIVDNEDSGLSFVNKSSTAKS